MVHINAIDWLNYSNENYISLDSEVNHYLNWIEKVPSSRFSIDENVDYCNYPAHIEKDDYRHYIDTLKALNKVSVVVIEEYWKTKKLIEEYWKTKVLEKNY